MIYIKSFVIPQRFSFLKAFWSLKHASVTWIGETDFNYAPSSFLMANLENAG